MNFFKYSCSVMLLFSGIFFAGESAFAADIYPADMTQMCPLSSVGLQKMLYDENSPHWERLSCACKAANYACNGGGSSKEVRQGLSERGRHAQRSAERDMYRDVQRALDTCANEWNVTYVDEKGKPVKPCNGLSVATIVSKPVSDDVWRNIGCIHKVTTSRDVRRYGRQIMPAYNYFWNNIRPELEKKGMFGTIIRVGTMWESFRKANRGIFASQTEADQRIIQQAQQEMAVANNRVDEAFAQMQSSAAVIEQQILNSATNSRPVTPQAPPPLPPSYQPEMTDEDKVYHSGITAEQDAQINQAVAAIQSSRRGHLTRRQKDIDILPGVSVEDLLKNSGHMRNVDIKLWKKITELVKSGQDLTPFMEVVSRSDLFDSQPDALALLFVVYGNSLPSDQKNKLLSFVVSARKPSVRYAASQAAVLFAKEKGNHLGKFVFDAKDKQIIVRSMAVLATALKQADADYKNGAVYQTLLAQVSVLYPQANIQSIDGMVQKETSNLGTAAQSLSGVAVLALPKGSALAQTLRSTLGATRAAFVEMGPAIVVTAAIAEVFRVLVDSQAFHAFWGQMYFLVDEGAHQVELETFPAMSQVLPEDVASLAVPAGAQLVTLTNTKVGTLTAAEEGKKEHTCKYDHTKRTSFVGNIKTAIAPYINTGDPASNEKWGWYLLNCPGADPRCVLYDKQFKEVLELQTAFYDSVSRQPLGFVKAKYLNCAELWVPEVEIQLLFIDPLRDVIGLLGESMKNALFRFMDNDETGMTGKLCRNGRQVRYSSHERDRIYKDGRYGILKHIHYEEYKPYASGKYHICNHALFGKI